MKEQLKQAIINLIIHGNSCQYIYINKDFNLNLTSNIRGDIIAEISISESMPYITYTLGWGVSENSDFDKATEVALIHIGDMLDSALTAVNTATGTFKRLNNTNKD